ncbi:MAG: hypothetical protein U9O97_04085 [Elusimicrobiota bacterium]|nr:hypothetical protein [Elusimicrobiota bacterium]
MLKSNGDGSYCHKVFISAGDFSGDLFASRLAKTFIKSGWDVSAVGGAALAGSGAHVIEDIVKRNAIGFVEPLKNISFFRSVRSEIKSFCERWRPDAAVLVDFWGFNSCLLPVFAKAGIPVFYYICPQIWASRFGRIKKMKKYVRKVFPVFPFEEKIYLANGVSAFFPGHPLSQMLPVAAYNPDSPYIGLLPGSRKAELARHLPVMTDVARLLGDGKLRFKCFKAPSLGKELYSSLPENCELVEDRDYSHRKNLRFSITSSGTASFENAMLGIPMAIMYKTSFFSYNIARLLVKTRFIGMPNILAGKCVAPEFIQTEARAGRILHEARHMLKKDNLLRTSGELLKLRSLLDKKNAEANVVREIEGNT